MKIFLHIGMARTGATLIRDFFLENRERMAGKGICYPVTALGLTGSHGKLVAYAQDDERESAAKRECGISGAPQMQGFRRDLLRGMAMELRQHKPASVFMTDERLAAELGRGEIERLHNLLTAFSRDITVIVYVGRQVDHFAAARAARIVRGEPGVRMEPDSGMGRNPAYRYLDRIDAWADAFGKDNIIVRPYEPDQLKDGDVVRDCLDILEVEGEYEFSRERSRRPSAACLRFLELMNRSLPRYQGKALNPYHREIGDLVRAVTDGAPPEQPEIRKCQSLFDKQNAEIARKYLGREDGRLFRRKAEDGVAGAGEELTVRKAVEISSKLWTEQWKTITSLSAELVLYRQMFMQLGILKPEDVSSSRA